MQVEYEYLHFSQLNCNKSQKAMCDLFVVGSNINGLIIDFYDYYQDNWTELCM